MSKEYQVISKSQTRKMADFLSKEGQLLLPMLELITQAELAVDELIDLAGRATIEAVLKLSAQELAGPKHPGKAAGQIRWHGQQKGSVALAERKLRVDRPRLRVKHQGKAGEVKIPAYEALNAHSRLAQRVLEVLMAGISTRSYAKVLPQMAESVGLSKSAVSREFIEASEKALKELAERCFDDKDILIIYLDGLVFGRHHVLTAIGVDTEGYKHVLGLVEGASENAAAVKALLEDLVGRGIKPGRRRLFVIDGSKALRAGVEAIYGQDNPVQRCRAHKIRNVVDHLPKHLKERVRLAMRAAYRLEPKEGMDRLKQQARWLEKDYPSAAGSLREGLAETFTINRIGLPKELRRCLSTTNVIESPQSGVRRRTRRVCRWQDSSMVLRWTASALLTTEKNFRRIMGYKQIWHLRSYLDQSEAAEGLADQTKVG